MFIHYFLILKKRLKFYHHCLDKLYIILWTSCYQFLLLYLTIYLENCVYDVSFFSCCLFNCLPGDVKFCHSSTWSNVPDLPQSSCQLGLSRANCCRGCTNITHDVVWVRFSCCSNHSQTFFWSLQEAVNIFYLWLIWLNK